MTAIHPTSHTASTSAIGTASTPLEYVLGITRLLMGWVFLWPFLDKTFGLGHETASKDAWVDGGSPTAGFLGNAVKGPFDSFYHDMAGQGWADWLFMLGLLGIGVALILGVFVRLAAVSGVVLMVLMWAAVLPPDNNPFLDDHIIYALVLVILALTHAGRFLGLGAIWQSMPFVKRSPILE